MIVVVEQEAIAVELDRLQCQVRLELKRGAWINDRAARSGSHQGHGDRPSTAGWRGANEWLEEAAQDPVKRDGEYVAGLCHVQGRIARRARRQG